MFDIAWSEIAVIGAVALVVIGPKELPHVLRKAGRIFGRLRVMTNKIRRDFDEIIRQAEESEEAPVSPWPREDVTGRKNMVDDHKLPGNGSSK